LPADVPLIIAGILTQLNLHGDSIALVSRAQGSAPRTVTGPRDLPRPTSSSSPRRPGRQPQQGLPYPCVVRPHQHWPGRHLGRSAEPPRDSPSSSPRRGPCSPSRWSTASRPRG